MAKRGKSLDELVKELSPNLQEEVWDFVEFLSRKRHPRKKGKMTFSWRGCLKEYRDKFTSVELQHKAMEWRIEDEVSD